MSIFVFSQGKFVFSIFTLITNCTLVIFRNITYVALTKNMADTCVRLASSPGLCQTCKGFRLGWTVAYVVWRGGNLLSARVSMSKTCNRYLAKIDIWYNSNLWHGLDFWNGLEHNWGAVAPLNYATGYDQYFPAWISIRNCLFNPICPIWPQLPACCIMFSSDVNWKTPVSWISPVIWKFTWRQVPGMLRHLLWWHMAYLLFIGNNKIISFNDSNLDFRVNDTQTIFINLKNKTINTYTFINIHYMLTGNELQCLQNCLPHILQNYQPFRNVYSLKTVK